MTAHCRGGGQHPRSTACPRPPPASPGPTREGAIWVADALGNRALRVRDGGEIGWTLFLCTAPGFAEHERRDTREARLLAVEVAVPAAG